MPPQKLKLLIGKSWFCSEKGEMNNFIGVPVVSRPQEPNNRLRGETHESIGVPSNPWNKAAANNGEFYFNSVALNIHNFFIGLTLSIRETIIQDIRTSEEAI